MKPHDHRLDKKSKLVPRSVSSRPVSFNIGVPPPVHVCAALPPTLNTNQSHLLGQNVYQWKGVLQGYSNICELCRCSNDWLGYHTFADCADTCSRQGFSHFQHANGRKPNGETGDYNCACCNTDSYASDPTWGVNVYAFQSAVPAAVSASSRARLVPSAALALCLFAWELSAIAVTPSRPDNSGMFMA